jgi:hypothetical protein
VRFRTIFSLFGLLSAAALLAGSPPEKQPQGLPPLAPGAIVKTFGPGESVLGAVRPQEFGTTDEGITIISFTDFVPASSDTTYNSDFATGGTRWPTAGSAPILMAPVRGIPNGATVTEVQFHFVDDSAPGDITVGFGEFHSDASGGANPGSSTYVLLSSTGMPGDTEVHMGTSVPIRYQQDVDTDGTIETVDYVAYALTSVFNGDVAIRSVRFLWRRNVSPAPLLPTFADVLPLHPYFRHIEALANSGITSGCGGGNFCPDRPVTRGEMAVFLAKALGLHWPAFSGP